VASARHVLDAAAAALGDGEAVVLATVVRVQGSAYRRPGARTLFRAQGDPLGIVSGGCLEADLAERARELLREGGASRTVVYDMRSPDDIVWGLGLGCDGEVRVLLERLDPARSPQWLSHVVRARQLRQTVAVATVFDSHPEQPAVVGARCVLSADGSCHTELADSELALRAVESARRVLRARRSSVQTEAEVEFFTEYLAPPLALIVVGAGADAQPLARFACDLGWSVRVLDHRAAFATPQRFPSPTQTRVVDFNQLSPVELGVDDRTAIVLMTHHFLNDLSLMERLLPAGANYFGVIGPRKRTEKLVEELARRGIELNDAARQRLYGPIGLDIGSETPQEIALAVLGEIQAAFSGRAGGFLRELSGPLHEPL